MKSLAGVLQLKEYVAKRKKRLFYIILLAICCSILELCPAQIVARIVDILPTAQLLSAFKWVLLFGGTYILSSILALVYGILVMNFNNEIIEDVRKDVFRSVIHREVKVTDQDISGDVITRSTGDVEQITRVIAGPLNGFLRQILIFVSSLAILGAIDLKLILVTLAVSMILCRLSKRVSNKNKEYGRLEREQIGKISTVFSDILKNCILIKSYGTENIEIERLEALSNGVLNCRKSQMGYMTRYWSGVEICNCAGYVAAFLACVYEIKAGRCSIGQVIVVYSYLQRVFSTMVNLSRYRTDFFNADAALTRVFSLVDKENIHFEHVEKGHDKIEKVVVSNLTVTCGNRRIVENLNMEMRKGTVTALVAESGKGKSSVIQTFAGFTEISGGKMFFDQRDVTNQVLLRRKMIRICFQLPYLQQKTIRENLCYGKEEENQCFEPIVRDIVQKKGLEEILDSSNNRLSGGEARRIALARTVNRRVPFYLFDEPTAEMDEENRKKVIKAIRQLSHDSIVLVATHDHDLIDEADQIVRL